MPPEILRHIIDGTPRPSETGKSIPIVSPLTGNVSHEIARGGPVEANLAVKSSRVAGETWRKVPRHERSEILRHISKNILDHREDLARQIVSEVGKPLREARIEVERAASVFSMSADAVRHETGRSYPADAYPYPPGNERRMIWTRREPLGVVVAISPFNFPLNLLSHKVAPALAAGNTVVAKPASFGAGVGVALAGIALDSGLPPGVLNVVLGSGGEVGMSLVTHPAVRLVTLTGSVDTGRRVAERAGAGGKKVLLELGGMDPMIVFEDAPLDPAVDAAVRGTFAFSGQVCTATKRLLVASPVLDRFLEAFSAKVAGLVVGDPTEESTQVGPIIDSDSVARIEGMVADATERGAKLVLGGGRVRSELGPYYFAPTILSNVPGDARVVQEEPFGPLAPVQGFSDEEEAISLANSTRYGLQAAIFTSDIGRALRVARELQVGGVHINDPTTLRWDALPFGGSRASGWGREGVDSAIEEMSEIKLISLNSA